MGRALIDRPGTLTCNPWEWVPLAWFGMDLRWRSVGSNQPAQIHADDSSFTARQRTSLPAKPWPSKRS